jgi:hypothetical protein
MRLLYIRTAQIVFLFASILFANQAWAQVAISTQSNTTTPDPTAVLLLVGDGTQGLIIPTINNITPSTPGKAGMIAFSGGKVYYHDGNAWFALGAGGGGSQTITISGNQVTLSGTTPINLAKNFLPSPNALMVYNTATAEWEGQPLGARPSTTQALVWNATTNKWDFQAIGSATVADGSITGGTAGTGVKIAANTITDANVSTSALIAGSKIDPTFTIGLTAPSLKLTGGGTSINGQAYTWPAVAPAANTFLQSDAVGNLSWALGGGFSTNNSVPRGNGTGLAASTIQDNGTTASIGTVPDPNKKLIVSNSTTGILHSIYGLNSQVGGGSSIGIGGEASGSTNTNFGVYGTAFGSGTGATGVFGSATGTTGINYGIYGTASGAPTNWAGYFLGNAAITGNLNLAPGSAPVPTTDRLYNVGGNLFWNGTNISSGGSGWSLTGNIGLVDGTNNFIGTQDGVPINFRLSNLKAGRIDILDNTFLGQLAGNSTNVGTSNNTAVGGSALKANTSGTNNTAVGVLALTGSTGSGNTAVGSGALISNSAGNNNTAIGNGANVSTGGLSKATAIGYNAIAGASNSLVLGGTGADAVNVGIGTTSPISKLDVSGDLRLAPITAPSPTAEKLYNVGGNLFWNGTNISSGGSGWSLTGNAGTNPATNFLGTTDAQPLIIRNSGVESMRINTSYISMGGRTTPVNANSFFDLQTDNGAGLGGMYVDVADPDGDAFYGYSNLGVSRALTYMDATTGSWNVQTAGSDRLSITSGGNVGIGTVAPVNKLDVEGGVAIGATYSGTSAAPANGLLVEGNTGIGTSTPLGKLHVEDADYFSSPVVFSTTNAATAGPTLRFSNPSAVGNHVYDIIGSTGGAASPGIGSFGIWDATSSLYRFVIKPSGNVGIGTTAPTTPLHVESSNAAAIILGKQNGAGVAIQGQTSTGYGIYGAAPFNGGTSAWTNLSDKRLKKNILPLENSLDNILKMKGVSFDWRHDEFSNKNLSKRHDIGVIAQELKEIYPEAVVKAPDGFYAVSYTTLVPVLIEAIKEQQKIIDQLRNTEDESKKRIAQLEMLQNLKGENKKLTANVTDTNAKQEQEIATLKKQMEEVMRIVGAEAKRK